MKYKKINIKILALSMYFLSVTHLFSVGFSWGIDTTGKCLFRSSIDSSSPWIVMTDTTLPLTWIGTAHNGQTWALTPESVPPAQPVSNIWFRNGITSTNLKGTGWTNIGGILASLSVGYNGELVGVNSNGSAFFRNGLNGTWISIGEGFKQLAIGPNGIIWAIKPDGTVWIRTGITASVPQGTNWMMTDGLLSNISVGKGGVLYGVNYAGSTYQRANITASNPVGSGWQGLSTTPVMASISASQSTNAVWAVDRTGKYYSWSGGIWQPITN